MCYTYLQQYKNEGDILKKILIVEDDQKLRNELKIFLKKNGYEALTIEKFDDSIQDILDKKADLILLDINLPYLYVKKYEKYQMFQ